jgi:hypothetical protein
MYSKYLGNTLDLFRMFGGKRLFYIWLSIYIISLENTAVVDVKIGTDVTNCNQRQDTKIYTNNKMFCDN